METHPRSILVVEDEDVTRTRLVDYFEAESFMVFEASDCAAARTLLEKRRIDVALLDINLPDDDGLMLARECRAKSGIGVILVTGKNDEIDRIVGLEIGADDYVTKPFSLRELHARVKNLLRRLGQSQETLRESDTRLFDGWRFHVQNRKLISPEGVPVSLTRGEYELLNMLSQHPGKVLGRERLLENITHRSWVPNDRTVDVLVRRLRQKIEVDPANPEIISTVHGEGYIFTASSS